jgi:hypothetical protein
MKLLAAASSAKTACAIEVRQNMFSTSDLAPPSFSMARCAAKIESERCIENGLMTISVISKSAPGTFIGIGD